VETFLGLPPEVGTMRVPRDQLVQAEAPIGNEPAPGSQRGLIQRNAFALLSNHAREPLDSPQRVGCGIIVRAGWCEVRDY
jgi:hypothetical protein